MWITRKKIIEEIRERGKPLTPSGTTVTSGTASTAQYGAPFIGILSNALDPA